PATRAFIDPGSRDIFRPTATAATVSTTRAGTAGGAAVHTVAMAIPAARLSRVWPTSSRAMGPNTLAKERPSARAMTPTTVEEFTPKNATMAGRIARAPAAGRAAANTSSAAVTAAR